MSVSHQCFQRPKIDRLYGTMTDAKISTLQYSARLQQVIFRNSGLLSIFLGYLELLCFLVFCRSRSCIFSRLFKLYISCYNFSFIFFSFPAGATGFLGLFQRIPRGVIRQS
jgi:hypothetical protein